MNLKQGLYKHYKGKFYFVFEVAHHSETREALVVYQCLYDDYSWWVRPQSMFVETISVGNEIKPRFEFLRSMSLDEAKNFSDKNE
jgi:hypothetical protein